MTVRSSANRPRRIAVFGGAFDPPHAAHVALAQAALAELQLDQLRVIPTGQAWHKTRPLSPALHRLAMARLAFAELPKVMIDARETERAGPSYTVDTLRELQREQPGAELFLLLGADQARALPSWHAWQEIVQTAIICVADRGDGADKQPRFSAPKLLESRFRQLPMPALPVSATEIRNQIATRQALGPLVLEPVARYIEHHHLYQTA